MTVPQETQKAQLTQIELLWLAWSVLPAHGFERAGGLVYVFVDRPRAKVYRLEFWETCSADVSEKYPRNICRLIRIRRQPSQPHSTGKSMLSKSIRKVSEAHLQANSYKRINLHNPLIQELAKPLANALQFTKMLTSVQDKDQWSANADSYAKGSQHLSNAPVEMVFTQMNCAYPFSTAKAILDVGSGPGVTIGRLIENYGPQIPFNTRL